MTDHYERIRAAFRLNLEQQKKRAKELLKAAKAGDESARARIARVTERDAQSDLKLSDAQFTIARELGSSTWAELKSHIESIDRARESIERKSSPPDAHMKTLHLRCGSDIKGTLIEAGFQGDFLEHSYPYCHGPVTTTPDHFEREARFLVEFAGRHMDLKYDAVLTGQRNAETRLVKSGEQYERIVLWMEHDCFDQLVLIRCLSNYAKAAKPRVLEIIDIDRFPGTMRFIGLGQLPIEAIRHLWDRRQRVTEDSLRLAVAAWDALTQSDPRALAALMRTGCAALPNLARALRRLLQELPSIQGGTSLTERLVLQVLATQSATINQLLSKLTYELDPLPIATDFMLVQTLERTEKLSQPLFTRVVGKSVWQDTLTITESGRQILSGVLDLMSLSPSTRWVGGVEIRGTPTWRWDEEAMTPTFR